MPTNGRLHGSARGLGFPRVTREAIALIHDETEGTLKRQVGGCKNVAFCHKDTFHPQRQSNHRYKAQVC